MAERDRLEALNLVSSLPTRVVFGAGTLSELGSQASAEGARRVLLVTDPGIVSAGHAQRAIQSLEQFGLAVILFDGAAENPTTDHVAVGLAKAQEETVDFLVALGGGSAMDCAKGINLLLTNGGRIKDYWGINKAMQPMLPSIAVPTTAGTGSEAQSFALISDAVTHRKMACGDRRPPKAGGLRPRVAVLDPELIATVPARVAAAAGIDALAHAVETAATNNRTSFSRQLSAAAWTLASVSFGSMMRGPADAESRAGMLAAAHLAGAAIEQSMLGAAHACANPLTARFGIPHGVAVGIMLPHVVRFNAGPEGNPYSDLAQDSGDLARRIEDFLDAAGLPRHLCACGVEEAYFPELAREAAEQWTAGFNPRPVSAMELLELYRAAA